MTVSVCAGESLNFLRCNESIMKRLLRFTVLLVVALAFVPFLPLYLERTMRRSWRMDHAGDIIEWGWKICSLREFWADYHYIKPKQNPAFGSR